MAVDCVLYCADRYLAGQRSARGPHYGMQHKQKTKNGTLTNRITQRPWNGVVKHSQLRRYWTRRHAMKMSVALSLRFPLTQRGAKKAGGADTTTPRATGQPTRDVIETAHRGRDGAERAHGGRGLDEKRPLFGGITSAPVNSSISTSAPIHNRKAAG